jgi:hypothetical protein
MNAPICPYCGATAVLVGADVIYPRRRDLAHKRFWKCLACGDAYVGCHPGTVQPLGRLADAGLRTAKQRAHAAFDPLWERKMRQGFRKSAARSAGYQWLAIELGIPAVDCHIGMFDIAQCERVVAACAPYHSRRKVA